MKFIFLAVLFIPTIFALETFFHFLGTFICNAPVPYWDVDVLYHEEDIIYDDFLVRMTPPGTSNRSMLTEAFAQTDGDGNNYYELYVIIFHSCTTKTGPHKLKHYLQEVPVVDGKIDVPYTVDLTEHE